MTMPRGASRALYTGNGQAAEFPFFFKVFEEDQLSVLLTSPAGVTSEATGWTAELDENGGTVRYLHNGAPLPEGWKLAIMRDMPFVQEVDLITGTRFDPEVIETALDVATAERQQLLERLARAVVVEPTDEAGPEALLADIRDARTSASASATSAAASANAAANSASAAAGSTAVATEQREAACICAGEAQDARDVAIAQAEAANILMEAELSKVNAIVAANKTDQQAAVTAARQWAEKAPDTPVDYDEEGNPRYSARHWAKSAQMNALNPDGVTVGVDDDGVLHALGGNLLLNSEAWITESGTWTAPVKGWYEVLLIGGGAGGYIGATSKYTQGGMSGEYKRVLRNYDAGEEIPVTIGAGGIGTTSGTSTDQACGGNTVFDGIVAVGGFVSSNFPSYAFRGDVSSDGALRLCAGGGPGNSPGAFDPVQPLYYGAGGGAAYSAGPPPALGAGPGAPGAVCLRWHDPAKAAGPQPAPALLSARRMASRAAGAPAAVNLYDPETGQGSVWREEDAGAQLAGGLVGQEAWREICAQKAAEDYAAWLVNPNTEAERFELLRQARDARLTATDYLVAPDYPLADDARAAVIAYRQALRDLPAEEGAPWDGGGEATPWPQAPGAAAAAEAGNISCA